MVLDVDNDGKKEILARNAWGGFKIWKSNGVNIVDAGFYDYITGYADTVGWSEGIRFIPMDIDGDGKDDFLARSGLGNFENNKSTGISFGNQGNVYAPDFIKVSAKYTVSGQYINELTDTFNNTVKYEYDENLDQLKNSTDVRNNVTAYQYDDAGRVEKAITTTSDNKVLTVESTYKNDRLETITKNGFSYRYNYDLLGNLTSTSVENTNGINPLSSNTYVKKLSEGQSFDTGILESTTYGNGQKIEFAYDSLYRITAQKYNDTEKFNYQYDNSWNLGFKKDLVNNIYFRYVYDHANRLVQVKDITRKNSIKYEYDDNNNINKVSESEAIGGKAYDTTYTYDNDNKLKTVSFDKDADNTVDYTKIYSYDTLARLVNTQLKTTTGFKYSTNFSYALGADGSTSTRIKDMTNNGKTITYTHDKYGNIETINTDNKVIKYTYNTLNELVREDNQVLNKSIYYDYDLAGNMLSKSEYAYTTGELGTALNTVTYSYEDTIWKDKLTKYGDKTITYDEIGNIKTYDGNTFTWEMGKQLAGITGNGKTIGYKYDDSGIRTEKTYNGVTTTYILEGDHVISETTGSENPIHYTYSRGGSLISMNYEGQEYYYIKNAQGDIIGLYDVNGNEVVTYTYDTWGKLISIDGSLKDTVGVKNPYRYRSYRYDTETGLYYLQSRYYNPDWGRFISADAIVTGNEFAYCGSDPVNSAGFQQMLYDGGGGDYEGSGNTTPINYENMRAFPGLNYQIGLLKYYQEVLVEGMVWELKLKLDR